MTEKADQNNLICYNLLNCNLIYVIKLNKNKYAASET